ncbi:MAG: tail fiber assembly protein [Candidatus Heimdallarchaeaceae archaeon]
MFNWAKINKNGEVIQIGKTYALPQEAICIDAVDIDINNVQYYKYINGEFIKYERKVNITWEEVRQQRDSLLRKTDWTQLADAPLTAEEKEQHRVYRQVLRDIPQQYQNAEDAVFPTL